MGMLHIFGSINSNFIPGNTQDVDLKKKNLNTVDKDDRYKP